MYIIGLPAGWEFFLKFWSLVCAQQCPPPTSCSYIFCFQGILNLPPKTLMNSDMFMFVVQCQAGSFLPPPDSVASLVFQKHFWEYSFGRHHSIKRWNNISDVWWKQVTLPCNSDKVHCWCSVKRNWQEKWMVSIYNDTPSRVLTTFEGNLTVISWTENLYFMHWLRDDCCNPYRKRTVAVPWYSDGHAL